MEQIEHLNYDISLVKRVPERNGYKQAMVLKLYIKDVLQGLKVPVLAYQITKATDAMLQLNCTGDYSVLLVSFG